MQIIEIRPDAENYIAQKIAAKRNHQELVTDIVHIAALLFIIGIIVGQWLVWG